MGCGYLYGVCLGFYVGLCLFGVRLFSVCIVSVSLIWCSLIVLTALFSSLFWILGVSGCLRCWLFFGFYLC